MSLSTRLNDIRKAFVASEMINQTRELKNNGKSAWDKSNSLYWSMSSVSMFHCIILNFWKFSTIDWTSDYLKKSQNKNSIKNRSCFLQDLDPNCNVGCDIYGNPNNCKCAKGYTIYNTLSPSYSTCESSDKLLLNRRNFTKTRTSHVLHRSCC